MYIREKNGIDQLHGYSVGMVLNECGYDDSELIAMLIKKAMRDNNVDVWLFDFDVKGLIEYSQVQERCGVAQMYHNYIDDFVLGKDYTPRQYEYPADYVMGAQEFDESVRFYNATKFAYFLENPIDQFRVPIAYSYGDTNTLLRHPGNTRYMAMMAMPDSVKVQLLITGFEKNRSIIENAKSQSLSFANLADCSTSEIINRFDFASFTGVSVRYSNQVGIQVVEPHSRLPEFYQPYIISYTGSELYVNKTLVAQRRISKKKHKYFYMPGTKDEYLRSQYI